MSLEFKRKKSHSTKWSHKYPRARINNKGGDRKATIDAGWHKNNWNDDVTYNIPSKLIEKFLMANIGRPIDKVFSEFLEKCDSKLRKSYPLKKEFYSYIEKKEDIPWYGGFYITNGILNYKKGTKYTNTSIIPSFSECVSYNVKNMLGYKQIAIMCEKSNKTKSPQYLGNFYIYNGSTPIKKNVYIVDKDAYLPGFEISEIIGYGSSIELLNFNSQTRYNTARASFATSKIWDNKIRYKLMTKIKRETL